MNKIFTFRSSVADLNAFERNLNANGEVYIRTDNYDFKNKKGFKIMKKELL